MGIGGKRSVPLETFEVLRQNVVASGGGNFKSLNGYDWRLGIE
jgi:hypothetical protein